MTPVIISSLKNIKTISLSENSALFLTNEGQVYGCGDNSKYQLGRDLAQNIAEPFLLVFGNNEVVSKMYLGNHNNDRFYGFVVTEKGSVYSWGTQGKRLLGFENNTVIKQPHKLLSYKNFGKITNIGFSDNNNTDYGFSNSRIYGWGMNYNNLLDNQKTYNTIITPQEMVLK